MTDVLTDLFLSHGIRGRICSDNGSEFVAKAVRRWIVADGAQTAYIEPGGPWENNDCESFNLKLRDEWLDGEFFCFLKDPRTVIETWWWYDNAIPSHSAWAYHPPAPKSVPWPPSPASLPGAPEAGPHAAPRPTMN